MSSEIVPVQHEEGILASRPFGFGKGQFWTSLNLDSPKDAIQLIRMRQSGNKLAKECVNLDLKVVHIMRRWGRAVDDQTGEEREYLGTTFLTVDGDTISSGSIGIERDIESLFALGLIPPWSPPIDVKWVSVPGKGPNAMLQTVFNYADLEKRLAKKGKK